jgi:hypothetical protein
MRLLMLRVAAGAGLGVIVFATTSANAITTAAPAGVRHSANALHLTDLVHCRRYPHRHKNGPRWGRGCGVTPVVIDSGLSDGVVRAGPRGFSAPSRVGITSPAGRSGNFRNPMNPQDRSGGSNPQDMTQPRSFNPQDRR